MVRKGGGKVNYTSGSLARAKAKTKPPSPKKSRPATRALFPPRVLTQPPPRIELEQPDPIIKTPARRGIKSQKEWMLDSDLAIAREAASGLPTGRGDKGWWVGHNERSGGGKAYAAALARRVKAIREEEVVVDDEERQERKEWSRMVCHYLFSRSDFLDLPPKGTR